MCLCWQWLWDHGFSFLLKECKPETHSKGGAALSHWSRGQSALWVFGANEEVTLWRGFGAGSSWGWDSIDSYWTVTLWKSYLIVQKGWEEVLLGSTFCVAPGHNMSQVSWTSEISSQGCVVYYYSEQRVSLRTGKIKMHMPSTGEIPHWRQFRLSELDDSANAGAFCVGSVVTTVATSQGHGYFLDYLCCLTSKIRMLKS